MSNIVECFEHDISDQPLRYQTIGDALMKASKVCGASEASVSRHQNVRSTYASQARRSHNKEIPKHRHKI